MLEKIVLGGGCFWCMDAVFSIVKGVNSVVCGYSGGWKQNPSYEEVCEGNTGHAEVVLVEYDEKIVSLEEILEVFFAVHDPTSLNRQGNDVGEQYRSIILYLSKEQEERIRKKVEQIRRRLGKDVVTEVRPLEKFYPAEEYHQKYYVKNKSKPYCVFVISPKIRKLLDEFPEYALKE